MISKIFDEIIEETKTGVIYIEQYDDIEGMVKIPIRTKFNITDTITNIDDINLIIKNKVSFYNTLNEYVYSALKFYGLEENNYNIKQVLTFIWSNISPSEMNDIELFLRKYINFINYNFSKTSMTTNTSLGSLNSNIEKQSIKQETPYCFKSYFEQDSSRYYLPRISFGIENDTCYIYAIQNKDTKLNTNSEYNLKVKDKINSINRGIKKYRNVTPSFVVALANFLSYLKLININKVRVVSPLPVRLQNRDLTTNYKINLKTMKGTLNSEELEKFKEEVENKKINDNYNSTTKFINCFNRLKLHFDNIYLLNNTLEDGMIIEVINLINNNSFLQEVVDKSDENMLKCL